MAKRPVLALVLGWVLGAASVLVYGAATGGWYEYQLVSPRDAIDLVNYRGWETVSTSLGLMTVRRSRLHLVAEQPIPTRTPAPLTPVPVPTTAPAVVKP